MSYRMGPRGGELVTLPDDRAAEILRPAGNPDEPAERNWWVVRILGKKGTEIIYIPLEERT